VPARARGTNRRRGLAVVAGDVGTGPPLILLHGLAGSARWWTRNVPALSRSFRVLAIDLPGFGTSPRGQRLILDEAAGVVAATMDRLGIERASVIGHSMGGLIAGGLAADQPERVDRLVLVDAAFLSLGRSAVQSVSGPAVTLRWTAPSLLPLVVRDGLRAGPVRLANASIQLVRADWRAKLPRIGAPTLVIWGEHDRICPPSIGRRIVASIPGSRLVVVEGAAHNPMWEQPDTFDREVLDFLAE
jgi:pimeloyl-ACP methyl ester carboxylesterase